MNNIEYQRGQLTGTAQAIVSVHALMARSIAKDDDGLFKALNQHIEELKRLVGNTLQLHDDIGCPLQLSMLIIMLNEGYVPALTCK